MSCVIQRLMICSLGLAIHLFNPWATVFLFVELVKEVRKEIFTGWIWTRMSGDFTLGQHCSLLYYFISHGKKKNILFSLAIQNNSFPASPNPSPPPPPSTFPLPPTNFPPPPHQLSPSPPPPTFFATFVSFLPPNLPFLLVIWLSGSQVPLCPCV